jgi:hypothetical protein
VSARENLHAFVIAETDEDAAEYDQRLDAFAAEVRAEALRPVLDLCDRAERPWVLADRRAFLPGWIAAVRDAATETAPALLTEAQQTFLTFALDLAADRMADRSTEFTEEDDAALTALRRLATPAETETARA